MKYLKSLLLISPLLVTLNFVPAPARGQAQLLAPSQSAASPLDTLNLTAEQQRQLDSIREFLKAQVRTILSPAQYSQLESMRAAGQEPQLAALDLSKKQRKQLREAQGLAAERLALLLTPAQQKQLSEMLKSRR